ncbi:MAG: cupredoxin domain-containing protein [Pseudonocardiales bacterium]|nr:cupredoxin domain-containing protein [Pseudonocardiales bacterium]
MQVLDYRAAVLAAVASTMLVAACGSSPDTTASPPAQPPAVNQAAITVDIKNFAYLRRYFAVAPGATVTVRNDDQVIHTVTADNGAFNTGNVAQGLPASFQAPTKPGKYAFHCFHHPYMTGVLTVS